MYPKKLNNISNMLEIKLSLLYPKKLNMTSANNNVYIPVQQCGQ